MPLCLLVDDSRVVRKVARRIVEDMGYECDEAEDGRQALDYCGKRMPDVVLLDWHMPRMTGLEFVIALRQTPEGRAPKIVFCSTENDPARIQKALKAGADEYIMKPFDSDIIEAKFRQIGLIGRE